MHYFTAVLVFFLAAVCQPSFAEVRSPEESLSSAVASENVVDVQLVIDELHHIDVSAGNFKIVAESLLSWQADPSWREHIQQIREPQFFYGHLLEDLQKKIWVPEFVLANAEAKRETMVRTLLVHPNLRVELYEKFDAVLAMDTELPGYPFEDLDITIDMQAINGSVQELRLRPVALALGHAGVEHSVIHGNWSAREFFFAETRIPSLNFGGSKEFSEARFHVTVQHDYIDVAQKIFIPLMAITILSIVISSFCSLTLLNAGQNARIVGQLTLILTTIALKFSLSNELPRTHYVTFLDLLFLSVTSVVTINLLTSMYINHLFTQGNHESAIQLQIRSDWILPILAIVLIGICFALTVN